MGFRDLFKRNRKEVIRENQSRGKGGEEHIKSKYEFNGYKVTRTGKGHDFRAEKRDWWTGKKESKVIEVKTGNSPLSDLQKKKKRQYGSKYVVERLDHTPFGYVSQDDTYKMKRPTKKETKRSSGFDSMLGLGGNSSRPRNSNRSRSSSGFDSMFGLGGGSGGSRSSPRRKSNDYGFGSGLNDMFGSGGSSKKRRSSSGWGF